MRDCACFGYLRGPERRTGDPPLPDPLLLDNGSSPDHTAQRRGCALSSCRVAISSPQLAAPAVGHSEDGRSGSSGAL
jgi:hypothetical protein